LKWNRQNDTAFCHFGAFLMQYLAYLKVGTPLAFVIDCLGAFGHKAVYNKMNGKGGRVMLDHALVIFVVVVAMAFVTWLRWACKVKVGRHDHFLP